MYLVIIKIFTMSPIIVKSIGAYRVKENANQFPNNEFKIDNIIKRQNFI